MGVSFVVLATGAAFTGAVVGLVGGGESSGAGATTSGCSAFQSTLNKHSDKAKIVRNDERDYSSGGARRSSGGYKTA